MGVSLVLLTLRDRLTELTTATGTHNRAKRYIPSLKPLLSLPTMDLSIVVVRLNMMTSKDVRAISRPATAAGAEKSIEDGTSEEGQKRRMCVSVPTARSDIEGHPEHLDPEHTPDQGQGPISTNASNCYFN